MICTAFNENTFTVSSVGLICVVTVVVVPILNFISSSQAVFLPVGLGTFIATVVSSIIFAAPKLLAAFGLLTFSDHIGVTAVSGKSTIGQIGALKSAHGTDAASMNAPTKSMHAPPVPRYGVSKTEEI
ncbi:hypothetical protein HDV00_004885 [Rhizophlyctis rosea]|nr:hypothetical protein HDV00_004885 [Rhizophlyctis rosea]